MTTKNQIPDQWEFYFSRVRDQMATIRLNMALERFAPLQEYPLRVIFTLQMNEPNEDGLGSDAEFQRLNTIEDALFNYLENKSIICVGTCRNKGLFEMFFYAKNHENWEMIFEKALAQFQLQEQNYSLSVNEDSKWDIYFEFLFPNVYEHQAIQNRNICFHLEQEGDLIEQERNVDFWAYFPSKQDADAFADKITSAGYVVNQNELIEVEEPEQEPVYQVQFSKVTNVLWETINQISWDLVDFTQTFNGYFDGWETIILKE